MYLSNCTCVHSNLVFTSIYMIKSLINVHMYTYANLKSLNKCVCSLKLIYLTKTRYLSEIVFYIHGTYQWLTCSPSIYTTYIPLCTCDRQVWLLPRCHKELRVAHSAAKTKRQQQKQQQQQQHQQQLFDTTQTRQVSQIIRKATHFVARTISIKDIAQAHEWERCCRRSLQVIIFVSASINEKTTPS